MRNFLFCIVAMLCMCVNVNAQEYEQYVIGLGGKDGIKVGYAMRIPCEWWGEFEVGFRTGHDNRVRTTGYEPKSREICGATFNQNFLYPITKNLFLGVGWGFYISHQETNTHSWNEFYCQAGVHQPNDANCAYRGAYTDDDWFDLYGTLKVMYRIKSIGICAEYDYIALATSNDLTNDNLSIGLSFFF